MLMAKTNLFSTREAVSYLEIPYGTFCRWVTEGHIVPHAQNGTRSMFFTQAQLDRLNKRIERSVRVRLKK